MNTYKVTITSKNQITLPAVLVRKYNLLKNRELEIEEHGDELYLKPAPTFNERMAPLWKEVSKYIKEPMSDEDLKIATRQLIAKRGNR